MKTRALYKLDKIIIVLIFTAVIYAPFILGLMQDDQATSGIEKRALALSPSKPATVQEFTEYPDAFTQYYSDHFGLRESLTRAYFKLANKFDDSASVDDVTPGKDDWLFLGSVKPGYRNYSDPIGDAINVNLYTKSELEEFAGSIMKIKNWLSKKGIEYIYVIAPNKHTIYFENLPDYITKQNSESATDQLVKYLQQNTDVTVVDLRPVLLEAKKKQQVYYKSDTHWNHYGANVAQFEIMKQIETLFPDKISPSLLDDSDFEITTMSDGDLAKMSSLENFEEASPQPVFDSSCSPAYNDPEIIKQKVHTLICEGQSLNAVIFRDSFFIALQPYFAHKFHRSTYISEEMNYHSLVKYVEQEKPDIVIDEVVERTLPYVPSSGLFSD